jgi:transcriptional regulator with XRE-family HTH domain
MKTLENPQNTASPGDLELMAGRFLIEQDSPTFSDKQRAELRRWIMQSDQHCDAYLQMVRTWRWCVRMGSDMASDSEARRREPPRPRLSKLHRLFGNVVRTRREQLGWSVEELAARAWMAPEQIQAFETGREHMRLENVFILARGMNMAPSRLTTQLERALRAFANEIATRHPKIGQRMASAAEERRPKSLAKLRASRTKH